MLRYRLLLYITALLLTLTGCRHDEEEPQMPDTPPAVEPPAPFEGGRRTILVYIIGDNSIASYAELDLNEMRDAATAIGPDDRLLVYYNRRRTNNGNPPLLLDITAAGDDTLKVYADDPSIYSTDISRFAEVFADVESHAPAREYGLVLWSHGTGWIDKGATPADAPPRQRTFGDDRGHKLTIPDLARALGTAPWQWQFIWFDCCHMATVEVAYELRRHTPLIVASATELHGEGMRYDINLPRFFADGDAEVVVAARLTLEYYDARTGIDRSCTMSAIRTEGLPALAEATRALFAAGATAGLPIAEYQYFDRLNILGVPYHTLYDMQQYITTLADADPALIERWQQAFDDTILYAGATPRFFNAIDIREYGGLACFIPQEDPTPWGYDTLAWYRAVSGEL